MRKICYFASAVLMLTALAGCQIEEFRYDTYKPEKGEIVFRLADNARMTKSSATDAAIKGATISLRSMDGVQLYLEETITRLDGLSNEPTTKGTPAFTENFTELYGDFKAAAYKTNGSSYGAAPFDDGVFEKLGDKKMWKRKYGNDLEDNLPLYFFLRAPYDMEDTAVKNLKYNTGDGSISFNYDGSSLTAATQQKDLLFTSREVTSEDYKNLVDKETGIPVLFHHALTGVKFANFFDNPQLDTKTYITKVEITGLADGGKCVVTPRQETNGYVDDKLGDYSSDDVSIWNKDSLIYKGVTYVQEFPADQITYSAEGSFGDKGSYTGTSWATAGNKNNLNTADGSLTFWFVPQQLSANVKMVVHYNVVNTKSNTTHADRDTVDFGKLTRKRIETQVGDSTVVSYGAYADWKAGELRTYTLKPQYVEIDIVDRMKEYEKDSVKVTNNGNVYEYVRVNLVANWVGLVQIEEGKFSPDTTILNGYALQHKDSLRMVEAWNDKDGKTNYGEFVDLVPESKQIPATSNFTKNNWVRYDKYYYYINPIGPNESVTDQLFTSYTVGPSPDFWIVDKFGERRKAKDVHLVMDVMVQAIPASTDINGNITDNYIDAWVKALNKSKPEDLLDL